MRASFIALIVQFSVDQGWREAPGVLFHAMRPSFAVQSTF